MTENDTISWSELFNEYREMIENVPADLLGPPVDNLENELDNEETDNDSEDLEDKEQIQTNWMILSEMGPDAILDDSLDLGLRSIDQNYDWAGDVRRRCPDINLADAPNFIQQARELGILNEGNATNHAVNSLTLNDNQMRVFKRIESHYRNLISDSGHVEPLRLIIMGTAGTGKSYLINMI